MWKEWMSTGWPEGLGWAGWMGWIEPDRGWAGWFVWRWPWAIEEWQYRLRDNARKIGKSGEHWGICNWLCFMQPFLLGMVFFGTALSYTGGYHLERGGMLLNDEVSINCKIWHNYWNSRLRCHAYGQRGVCWMMVCVIWLDITTPHWWSEKVMVWQCGWTH